MARLGKISLSSKLHVAASIVESRMKALAPKRKVGGGRRGGRGTLKDSISKSVTLDTAVIGPNVPYAEVVEKGSAPHIIFGNPYLAFEINGATVIVRHVNHPGTSPQPYVAPAMEDSRDEINAMFARHIFMEMSR